MSSEYAYGKTDNDFLLTAAEILISHLHVITQNWKNKFSCDIKDLGDQIRCIKVIDNEFFDRLLLNELGVTQGSIIADESYGRLFEALCPSSIVGADYDKRYIDRSFEWINNKMKRKDINNSI